MKRIFIMVLCVSLPTYTAEGEHSSELPMSLLLVRCMVNRINTKDDKHNARLRVLHNGLTTRPLARPASDGTTVLHVLAELQGESSKIESIIAAAVAQVKKEDRDSVVNAADCNGMIPLHVAAQNGSIAVVQALLDAGAHILWCDTNGRTSLHRAAQNIDCPDILPYLCQVISKQDKRNATTVLAQALSHDGMNPLFLAAEACNIYALVSLPALCPEAFRAYDNPKPEQGTPLGCLLYAACDLIDPEVIDDVIDTAQLLRQHGVRLSIFDKQQLSQKETVPLKIAALLHVWGCKALYTGIKFEQVCRQMIQQIWEGDVFVQPVARDTLASHPIDIAHLTKEKRKRLLGKVVENRNLSLLMQGFAIKSKR